VCNLQNYFALSFIAILAVVLSCTRERLDQEADGQFISEDSGHNSGEDYEFKLS
jgi:hypothetical protein